jgi:hypothetical protein
MQNLQNGVTVPTNSDEYNLTQHLAKAFDDANVVIPVTGVPARDALVKRDGMPVTRLDLGGLIEVWDADMAVWTRGIQHAEYTGTTAPTPGASWGTGPLSLDPNASWYGGIFVSPGPDKITLPGPGVYALSARVQMGVPATGTTWVAITNDANTRTYTSFDIQPGVTTGMAAHPNIMVRATTNIRIVFYSTTDAGVNGYTLNSRVAVTRVG